MSLSISDEAINKAQNEYIKTFQRTICTDKCKTNRHVNIDTKKQKTSETKSRIE